MNDCKSNTKNAVFVTVLITLLTFLLITVSYLFSYLGNENGDALTDKNNSHYRPTSSPIEWNLEVNTTLPTTNGLNVRPTYSESSASNSIWESKWNLEVNTTLPTTNDLNVTYSESFDSNSNWSSQNNFILLFDHHVYISLQSRESVSAKWIEQRLNHFNVADERTWKQRYFVNDTFYELGGPAFLMVSGENPVDSRWIKEGQWMEWARDTHAICFILEHRYYGKSRPTKYLNTAQALADLANFRTLMTDEYELHQSKWISLGSYYAGCLALFLRLKYPHLFEVAIATGPLYFKNSPQNYFLNFSYSNMFNLNCSTAIDEGISQLRQIITNTEDWSDLPEQFRLCNVFESSPELGILIDSIENYFLSTNKNITDEVICNIMTEKNNRREIDRIAIIYSLMLDSLELSCLEIASDKIADYLVGTNWNDTSTKNGVRQWLYQMCSELSGFWKDNNFYWKCAIIFNDGLNYYTDPFDYTDPIDNKFFNMFYGDENLNITKSIIIVNPKQYWLQTQVFPTVNNEAVKVIRTQNISEFSEMEASSPTDSDELIQTREAIYKHVIKWLS